MIRAFVLGVSFAYVIFHYGWNSPVAIGPPQGLLNTLIVGITLLFIVFSKHPRRKTRADKFFWFFALAMALATLVGLSNGHSLQWIRVELTYLALYSSYLAVAKNEEDPLALMKGFFFVMAIASFVVAAEFYVLVSKFGLMRVLSRQQTVLAGVPIGAVAYFFLLRGRPLWERVLVAAATLATGLAVIFSVQRTTVAGLAIAFPLIVTLLWLRGWLSGRGYILSLLGFALSVGITLLVLYLSPYRWFLEVALQRIEGVAQGFANTSLRVRIMDAKAALALWFRQPLLGQGIGSELWLWWLKQISFIMDNSFVVYLWKTGVLGFLAFSLFYFNGLYMALRGFWRAQDPEKAFIYFTALGFLSFQLIVATTTANFYIYRFQFIWGALIGALALAEGSSEGAPATLQKG